MAKPDASKITLHMVASLDGFIAKRDPTIDWLHSTDSYEKGVTLSEEEMMSFNDAIDCYIMGSKTYEHAMHLGWPYGEKPVIVLTSRTLPSHTSKVEFYQSDIRALVKQLQVRYQNIWLVGGANTAKSFLQYGLVDGLVMTITPILLGDGLLFFDFIEIEQRLHLKDVQAFQDGMVELTYEVI